jgi:hypothetical protein
VRDYTPKEIPVDGARRRWHRRRRRVRERKGGVKKKAVMANQQFMTTQEYLNTPESLVPTELIYGKLRVADSPLVPHQRL